MRLLAFLPRQGRQSVHAANEIRGARRDDPLVFLDIADCVIDQGPVKCLLWVTGGKTPSEYMFSELPQLADIVRSAFDHLENPLVLRITAFWVRAI